MTRGRKPDAPALQAAKGNPGRRRKTKETPADRAAALLAAPPTSSDPLAPPAFLADTKLRPALAIWCELVPELRRLNLLAPLDRHTFAMYCVHLADWIAATKDISNNGHSYTAQNVTGTGELNRLNPAVRARELAERHILDIGSRFGLDPASRYKLLRDQGAVPSGGLFDATRPAAPDTAADALADMPAPPAPGDDDPVGFMRRAGGRPH